MKNIDRELQKKYLTKDKTKKLTLMLNEKLVQLFKNTAEENNIKVTQLMETWILKYLEDNNKL